MKRLFPQGIVAQADVNKLMANGVLARPVPVDVNTAAEPEFNQREYQQWMSGPHGDLPQTIINRLAKNHKRNDSIVAHYVDQQEKYGKTIMFADRWYQCEYLREGLRKRGVRADVMYSPRHHRRRPDHRRQRRCSEAVPQRRARRVDSTSECSPRAPMCRRCRPCS